jgi:hypothetical protein
MVFCDMSATLRESLKSASQSLSPEGGVDENISMTLIIPQETEEGTSLWGNCPLSAGIVLDEHNLFPIDLFNLHVHSVSWSLETRNAREERLNEDSYLRFVYWCWP